MIKTFFIYGLLSRASLLKALKKMHFILIITLSVSASCYALSEHPTWLQESLDKADHINLKSPSLALEFTQSILKDNQNLSPQAKSTIYMRLAKYHYIIGNIDKSLHYVNQFYALNSDLGSEDGISTLITHAGLLDMQGEAKQAMDLYLQAESLSKKIESKKLLAETYSFMASSFSKNNNDVEALKYYHQAYLHIKALDDELEMAYLKVQMSRSYSYLDDNEKAITLAKEAIYYFHQHEYYFDELFAQSALAKNYISMKQYNLAIECYENVIELSSKVETENLIGVAYLGLAKTYHIQKQHNKASQYFDLYQKIQRNAKAPSYQIDNLLLGASIAFATNNIVIAKESLKQVENIISALNEESMLFWRIKVLDFNADIAVYEKNYLAAYQFQTEARKLLSTYQNNEREKVRSKYKIMFDTDQALLKNQLLEQNKELDKVSLENAAQKQKLQTLFIIIISLCVVVLIFFIIRQFKNSKVLNRLANTDPLTELANRRYTFTHAENMLLAAKKSNQNFAVIMFDIDHFKQVNDTYGHAAGDIVLKGIGDVASEYVRDNDILGRIGGEEFLLVLPNTSATQAIEVAERIRVGIELKKFIIADKSLCITASFGVAELTQTQQDFSQLFQETDTALYQAKNNGRNNVSLAG